MKLNKKINSHLNISETSTAQNYSFNITDFVD